MLGLVLILFLVQGLFDFSSPSDSRMKMTGLEGLPDVLKEDRKGAIQ